MKKLFLYSFLLLIPLTCCAVPNPAQELPKKSSGLLCKVIQNKRFDSLRSQIASANGLQVRKVLGGLHLHHADQGRLKKTADFLQKSEIRELHLLHCTGENAIAYLHNALPDILIRVSVLGTTIAL